MTNSTIKKVETESSPQGAMGQRYLVAGKRLSMRLWIDEPAGKLKSPTTRNYETFGYVISGRAKECRLEPCTNTRSSNFLLRSRLLPRRQKFMVATAD